MRGDPLPTRARRWARWRRHRLGDAWAHRAHVDALHDEARATWLCSWQRSGSTILAEVLASAPGTRLVYEPANVPGALHTGEAAAAVPLPTGAGPELAAVERALQGRLHDPWVDQLCAGHVFRRRVVKDVRAMALLPIVATRHPATPIVVLVRHPLAVARSVVELGWSTEPEPAHAVLAEVDRWVTVHATALRATSARRALLVAYEHLVLEPTATLDAVLEHLGAHHATWRGLAIDRARLDAPSATTFRTGDARTGRAWLGDFSALGADVVAEAVRRLEARGLAALYGAEPEPRVGPGGVAAALVGR